MATLRQLDSSDPAAEYTDQQAIDPATGQPAQTTQPAGGQGTDGSTGGSQNDNGGTATGGSGTQTDPNQGYTEGQYNTNDGEAAAGNGTQTAANQGYTEASYNSGDNYDPEAWLKDLSQRYGVGEGNTDLQNLKDKNPEDIAKYQQDLEAQYARRAAPKPGYQTNVPGQPATAPGVSSNSSDFLNKLGLGDIFGAPGMQGMFNGDLQQVGQDPLSKLVTGGYSDLIGNNGQTPFGADMSATLAGLISRGGKIDKSPQDQANRLEAARQPIESLRKAQTAQYQGQLAGRGLMSEPGVTQGSEIGAQDRLEQSLAPYYATAGQNLATASADADNTRLSQALSEATGLSLGQAQTQLGALSGATNRQQVLSQIALDTLGKNMEWNKFLAELGLQRTVVMNDILQGRIENVAPLLALFQQYATTTTNGAI